MYYSKIKYHQKIKFIIYEIEEYFKSHFNDIELQATLLYYSKIKPKNICINLNIDFKYLSSIIRKIQTKKDIGFIGHKILMLKKIINYSFTWEERFISKIDNPSWKWLFFLLNEKYIFCKNALYCKKQFKYVIYKIKKQLFDVSSSFYIDLISKEKCLKKYFKQIYKIDNFIFENKDDLIKHFILRNKKIHIENNLHDLSLIINKTKSRNLLGLLERKDYLLKKNSKEFIYYYENLIEHKDIVFSKIKNLVEIKKIYKFQDILEILKKDNIFQNILNDFPDQSLYYFIKKHFINNFSFDVGNMMVIYPKKENILRLKNLLEKTYPSGYGKINLNYLKQKGFSKYVVINSKGLIWKNIYLNTLKQKQVFEDFEKITKNNLLNYIKDIYLKASKPTKLYIDSVTMYSRIKNKLTFLELIDNVFINKGIKNLQNKEKESFVNFCSDKIKNDSSEFLNLLFSNKASKINKMNKIFHLINHYNLMELILQKIYFKYRISPKNKMKIEKYLYNSYKNKL